MYLQILFSSSKISAKRTNALLGSMKRLGADSINSTNSKYNDILSNLQDLTRRELLSIANEINQIIINESSKIIESVPDDIRLTILPLSLHSESRNQRDIDETDQETKEIELSLRLFSCVSRRWSVIVNELVRYFFSFDPCFTSWVLSRSIYLTSLNLQMPELSLQPRVNIPIAQSPSLIKSIVDLNNLTSLIIPNTISILQLASFEDYCLKNLTNLIYLKIEHSPFYLAEAYNQRLTKTVKLTNGIIDYGVNNLTNLTSLYLPCVEINDSQVSMLTNLTVLRKLEPTYSGLSKLTNLSHLIVNTSIADEDLIKFTQLTRLDIFNIDAPADESISALTNLRELCVSYGRSKQRISIMKLTNITALSIRTDAREKAYQEIKYLPNLTKLDLSSSYTVNWIWQLFNLKSLNLCSAFSITKEQLSQLTDLQELNLDQNRKINNRCLKNLTNLTILNISKSDIDWRGLEYLTNLSTLTSQGLRLEITRECFLKLNSLTCLDIRKNLLIRFNDISLLTNLTSLDCSRNQFSVWQMRRLTHLRSLNVFADGKKFY